MTADTLARVRKDGSESTARKSTWILASIIPAKTTVPAPKWKSLCVRTDATMNFVEPRYANTTIGAATVGTGGAPRVLPEEKALEASIAPRSVPHARA